MPQKNGVVCKLQQMGYGSYVILLGVVKKMNHYTHLSLLLFLIKDM